MTPNERHALDALEAIAQMPQGAIEIKLPGVTVVFKGDDAKALVALARKVKE